MTKTKEMRSRIVRGIQSGDTDSWLYAIVQSESGAYYHIERGETINHDLASIGKYRRIYDHKVPLALELWDEVSIRSELMLSHAGCIDYYSSPKYDYRDIFSSTEKISTR